VEFNDVSAFIHNPSTNEVFPTSLEGHLHAREDIAPGALNRLLGRGVDVSDYGPIDHLLVGLQDVRDPGLRLEVLDPVVLRRKFIAISFDNRPE
jgi:hypothetical protein